MVPLIRKRKGEAGLGRTEVCGSSVRAGVIVQSRCELVNEEPIRPYFVLAQHILLCVL